MALPRDHPQRRELNDEVHARPPEALAAPVQVTFLAILTDLANRERHAQLLAELVSYFDVEPPRPEANHLSADLGPFRIKWERHTEFTRYKFIVPGGEEGPFVEPAIEAVPTWWLDALPGELMVAAHAALIPAGDGPLDHEPISRALFGGNTLIGATIAGGNATALTDLRIHEDGFSRFLILNRGMPPRQSGRMLQRLLEIETYRVMALLALPLAREIGPVVTRCQQELESITHALVSHEKSDESALLDRLTGLAAEIESRASDSHYRFGAAAAYHDLVQQRTAELREERIQGLQTFREFTERRLAPAMHTVRSVATRQESLSQHVARATNLLSTRVEIARESHSHALLVSMNQRAQAQLRLQQTVEGLSVAAVTYYTVGLVGYATKGLAAAGVAVPPDLAVAVSVPVVAVLVALGLRRTHRLVAKAVPP